MKCGVDKLSNANISKLLFVKIEQGGTQLAQCCQPTQSPASPVLLITSSYLFTSRHIEDPSIFLISETNMSTSKFHTMQIAFNLTLGLNHNRVHYNYVRPIVRNRADHYIFALWFISFFFFFLYWLLSKSVLTTLNLCSMGWCELKFKYWSVWVGFLYIWSKRQYIFEKKDGHRWIGTRGATRWATRTTDFLPRSHHYRGKNRKRNWTNFFWWRSLIETETSR